MARGSERGTRGEKERGDGAMGKDGERGRGGDDGREAWPTKRRDLKGAPDNEGKMVCRGSPGARLGRGGASRRRWGGYSVFLAKKIGTGKV